MTAEQIPDDDGIQVDDVKAIRREGRAELKALMRAQIAIGRSRLEPPAKPVPQRPPGPPPDWSRPKAEWDAAVRHYRNTEHHPDQPCDCGNCPPKETR